VILAKVQIIQSHPSWQPHGWRHSRGSSPHLRC